MPSSNIELPAGDWSTLRALLDEALALPPDARPAWLDGLDDARFGQLKPRLRALLGHVESPLVESLLNTMPKVETDQFAPSASSGSVAAGAGAEVGPYRLLQRLGEGGMATVWLAERMDVLQGRKVALKLPHNPLRRDGLAEHLARERENARFWPRWSFRSSRGSTMPASRVMASRTSRSNPLKANALTCTVNNGNCPSGSDWVCSCKWRGPSPMHIRTLSCIAI